MAVGLLLGSVLVGVGPAGARNPTSTGATESPPGSAEGVPEDLGDGPRRLLRSASKIQVLRTAEDEGGRVALEIAIPPSIGELAPVAENFGVLAGGQLLDFEVEPITSRVDVIVAIDTSGSMSGDALAAAKQAASRFVDSLPAETTVGVVSFGQAVTVHRSPSLDRDAAVADIGGLVAEGETALWDGLVASADLAGPAADRPYVVILSDGDDTVSTRGRSDAVEALNEAGVSLYAIAIESPDADRAALDRIVSTVGGQLVVTTGVDELDRLYQEISARLESRYQLSFQLPEAGRADIAISVATDGAIATARPGLLDAGIGQPGSGPDPDPDLLVRVPDRAGESETATDTGSAIEPEPVGPELGAIGVVRPGPLGRAEALPIGLASMFLALTLGGVLLFTGSNRITFGSAAGADRVAGLNTRLAGMVENWLAGSDRSGRLERTLDTAGIDLRVGEFVVAAGFGVASAVLLAGSIAGFAAGIVIGLVAAGGIHLFVSIKIDRRRKAFADQLTGTVTIMIGALRAGLGLSQSIELVSREASSPTSEQFRRVVFESRVGRDTTESMMGVAERMESRDFQWVARAVAINRELGGDLTELLENVAETIRERRRVALLVRSLTAEGRASGRVLIALPILIFLFMLWRTPENTALLLDEGLGRVMLVVAVSGMIVGYLWIRRLVDVKY